MNKKLSFAILTITFFNSALSAYGYDNNTTTFYDEWGTKTGSARKGYNGNVEFYDEWGTKTGSARKGYNGNVDYFDEWGTKTGSSRSYGR